MSAQVWQWVVLRMKWPLWVLKGPIKMFKGFIVTVGKGYKCYFGVHGDIGADGLKDMSHSLEIKYMLCFNGRGATAHGLHGRCKEADISAKALDSLNYRSAQEWDFREAT